MSQLKYNIIDDYKEHGEDFNLTGDDNNAIYIRDYSDAELKKELDISIDTENLHWRDDWIFIFKDAYSKRRKEKLKKLSSLIDNKN